MKTHSPHFFARLDAHHRLAISLLSGLALFLLLQGRSILPTRLIASWDAFATVDLLLAWLVLFTADPVHVRTTARLQDTGRTLIFLLVVVASAAALLSVAFVLGPAAQAGQDGRFAHLALSVIAVIASWMLTHTVFAMRYAHLYYSGDAPEDAARRHGGMLVPGGQPPDYLDFAYFSFTIGMTFQVSDMQISSRRLRRLALLHAMLSFGFNTVVLALAVSVVSNLLR